MKKSKDQEIANAVIHKTVNMLPQNTRWVTIMMTVTWPKDPSFAYLTLIKVPETVTGKQLDLIENKIYEVTPPEKFKHRVS